MKRSTVIIIISIVVAVLLLFGALTAGIIYIASQARSIAEKQPEGTGDYTQGDEANAITDLAKKYNAIPWSANMKTTFSYEIRDKLNQIGSSAIVFEGDLIDVVREEGKYYAIFTDNHLSGADLVLNYKLLCTQAQVDQLAEASMNNDPNKYNVYITAASIQKITNLPQQSMSPWETDILVSGDLLETQTVVEEYGEY